MANGQWHLKHGYYGGYRGPSPKDPLHRPGAVFSFEDALKIGVIKTTPGVALATAVDFRKQGWVTTAMENDDQGQLGACVSFSAKHMREFLSIQIGHGLQEHAPIWLYTKMQEKFEPTELGMDTGAYISWAASVMSDAGFALETDWPYDPTELGVAPSAMSNFRATWYKNIVSVTVPSDVNAMKQVLSANHAFMLGFNVYNSFWGAQGSGVIPMPPDGDTLAGGHAVFCFGYQDDKSFAGGGYLWLLNQWADFSPENALQMPYAYVTGQDPVNGPWVSDCWSLALAKIS